MNGWIYQPDGREGGAWVAAGLGASQPELPGYVTQDAHARALDKQKKRGYAYAAGAYVVGAIMGAVYYAAVKGGR